MLLVFQALLLFFVGLSLAQEDEAAGPQGVRRLRLRRPRPVPPISDPDGIAEGRPIPLRRIPQGKTNFKLFLCYSTYLPTGSLCDTYVPCKEGTSFVER